MMKVYAYDNADALMQSPYLASYQETLTEMLQGKQVDVRWYFNCLPSSVVFMVEDADLITAICVVSVLDDYWLKKLDLEISAPMHMITSVYTKEAHRKKGYARKLILSVVKYYPNVMLETYAHWTPAMTLYLSTGFKPVDTKKGELGHIILFKTGTINVSYVLKN